MATTKATNAGTRKETKKTKKQILAERRKLRGDLGSSRDVMRTPKVPGLVLRWVNDEYKNGRNRIKVLEGIGYKVYDGESVDVAPPNGVTEANLSLGDGAIMAAGTDAEGNPMRAILMCIPEEVYEADQALKEEAIRAEEEGIFDQGKGEAHMYGGVRIGTT